MAADTSSKPKKDPKLPDCETIISDCVDKCPNVQTDSKSTVKQITPKCLADCRAGAHKGQNCQ